MVKLIKRHIFNITTILLKKLGYHLMSQIQVKSLEDFTSNILKVSDIFLANTSIDSIVFSKDRAMQLYAFLQSYKERVSNRGRMFILYKCSNERHKMSYIQLMDAFINEDFIFIEELQFRQQLIEILEQSDAGKILFYVDDMIFIHKIDYKLFGDIDTTSSILALSRGKDFEYSTVLLKSLTLPTFTKIGNNLEQFNWNYSGKFSDWTYPLGVSAYMYGRMEITAMLKSISFKAPNSLEHAMQVFLIYFKNRFGICTEFTTCVCVHANLVQTEGQNPVLGTFSVDQLLNLWESGKRIDLGAFYDKSMNITQLQEYTFI